MAVGSGSCTGWWPFSFDFSGSLAASHSASPGQPALFGVDGQDALFRDRFWRNINGKNLLLARRLVEAGVRLVTVNLHDDHINFW